MTEPDTDEMAPDADGKVPGTSATLLDLTAAQPVLDPEMSFSGWTIPATGQVMQR